MLNLDQFRHLIPDNELAGIYHKASFLYGKRIVHINSTYQGGGVAEILYSLVHLMNDVGIQTEWRILHGNPAFFEITKKFHNALQGGELHLTEQKKQLYQQVNEDFSQMTHMNHDCVVIHDPQPLPLIRFFRKNQPWLWRCHIDLTHPQEELWDYLKSFLIQYDHVIVSSDKFIQEDLAIGKTVILPAINPFSLKNMELPPKTILKYIKRVGIPTDKPILCQVSRLDPWKDPEGVLDVFTLVKEKIDCRLVFCYNIATDDPECIQMYDRVYQKAGKLVEKGDVLFILGNNDILVNAIQSFSKVIIQKSIREGFCLAVTEALWKAKPVVASQVGGIPAQIVNGETGYLLNPDDKAGFAERIVHLLQHPKEAQQLGEKAKISIRKNFLLPRLLSNHLDLLKLVIQKT